MDVVYHIGTPISNILIGVPIEIMFLNKFKYLQEVHVFIGINPCLPMGESID